MRKLLLALGFTSLVVYFSFQKIKTPSELDESPEIAPRERPKISPARQSGRESLVKSAPVKSPPTSGSPTPSALAPVPPLDAETEAIVDKFRIKARNRTERSEANSPVPRPVTPPGQFSGRVVATVPFAAANPEAAMAEDSECAAFAPPKNTKTLSGRVGLPNAFVYLEGNFGKPPLKDPQSSLVIQVSKCRLTPRVFGVRVGQRVRFRYQDTIRHTLETGEDRVSPARLEFSPTYQSEFIERIVRFGAPATMLDFRCAYHSWMKAFIGVLPHDYFAVTDNEGFFTMPEPPDNLYTLHVWHETAGDSIRRIGLINNKHIPDILYPEK